MTKTQHIAIDEVTKTQPVTETMLDLRIHINRGQPGALEYRSTNVEQPKQVNLVKKVPPLTFMECEELGHDKDYLESDIIKAISVEEQDAWQRQGSSLNYISRHGVKKLTSATTESRVASNSS